MATERDGRFLTDKESLAELVELMPLNQRLHYKDLKCLTLEAAFPNRRMVLYTLDKGRPEGVTTLLFGDIFISRISGPTISVYDEEHNLPAEIGMVPAPWRDRDIYLQVPQHFELKWSGKYTDSGVHFVPHYAVLIKSRSPELHQIDGHTYCTTLNKFRARFPGMQPRH